MSPEDRLIQLFVYHTGERVEFVSAPAGSGKTHAVATWLDSAGSAADQIWLDGALVAGLEPLPRRPIRPTFVVFEGYRANPTFNRALFELIDATPSTLGFVIISDEAPPPLYRELAETGMVRITTLVELTAARAG